MPSSGAHSNEDGIETFVEDLVQVLYRPAEAKVHAEVDDIGDLPLDDLRRQTMLRHSHPEHAARHGQGFEDR